MWLYSPFPSYCSSEDNRPFLLTQLSRELQAADGDQCELIGEMEPCTLPASPKQLFPGT